MLLQWCYSWFSSATSSPVRKKECYSFTVINDQSVKWSCIKILKTHPNIIASRTRRCKSSNIKSITGIGEVNVSWTCHVFAWRYWVAIITFTRFDSLWLLSQGLSLQGLSQHCLQRFISPQGNYNLKSWSNHARHDRREMNNYSDRINQCLNNEDSRLSDVLIKTLITLRIT